MLVKDYDTYNAVYCSLCKQLGKDYSFLSRFILSYDCTFYVLVALAISDDCPGFKDGRCTFNPAKKCNYLKSGDHALSLASALSVCTAYYKLLDNIADGGFFERFSCRLIQPLFSHWRKKAAKKYPEVDSALADMTRSQQKVESDENCHIDMAAEPFAKMLSQVTAMLAENQHDNNSSQKKVLSSFGYFLGKWIYLIDAAADIDDDIKQGSFNPFLKKYDDPHSHIDEINQTLNCSLSDLLLSYELLNIKRFGRIIDNIIKSGLPKKQKSILFEKTEKKRNSTDI